MFVDAAPHSKEASFDPPSRYAAVCNVLRINAIYELSSLVLNTSHEHIKFSAIWLSEHREDDEGDPTL